MAEEKVVNKTKKLSRARRDVRDEAKIVSDIGTEIVESRGDDDSDTDVVAGDEGGYRQPEGVNGNARNKQGVGNETIDGTPAALGDGAESDATTESHDGDLEEIHSSTGAVVAHASDAIADVTTSAKAEESTAPVAGGETEHFTQAPARYLRSTEAYTEDEATTVGEETTAPAPPRGYGGGVTEPAAYTGEITTSVGEFTTTEAQSETPTWKYGVTASPSSSGESTDYRSTASEISISEDFTTVGKFAGATTPTVSEFSHEATEGALITPPMSIGYGGQSGQTTAGPAHNYASTEQGTDGEENGLSTAETLYVEAFTNPVATGGQLSTTVHPYVTESASRKWINQGAEDTTYKSHISVLPLLTPATKKVYRPKPKRPTTWNFFDETEGTISPAPITETFTLPSSRETFAPELTKQPHNGYGRHTTTYELWTESVTAAGEDPEFYYLSTTAESPHKGHYGWSKPRYSKKWNKKRRRGKAGWTHESKYWFSKKVVHHSGSKGKEGRWEWHKEVVGGDGHGAGGHGDDGGGNGKGKGEDDWIWEGDSGKGSGINTGYGGHNKGTDGIGSDDGEQPGDFTVPFDSETIDSLQSGQGLHGKHHGYGENMHGNYQPEDNSWYTHPATPNHVEKGTPFTFCNTTHEPELNTKYWS